MQQTVSWCLIRDLFSKKHKSYFVCPQSIIFYTLNSSTCFKGYGHTVMKQVFFGCTIPEALFFSTLEIGPNSLCKKYSLCFLLKRCIYLDSAHTIIFASVKPSFKWAWLKSKILLWITHCLDLNLNDQKTIHFYGCIPGMLGTYTIPK